MKKMIKSGSRILFILLLTFSAISTSAKDFVDVQGEEGLKASERLDSTPPSCPEPVSSISEMS